MKKLVLFFYFTLFISINFGYSLTSEDSFKRVLFISSYNPSFPTFQDQIDGLGDVFNNENIILDIEFMDSKRFNKPENLKNFKKSLSYKINNSHDYDVIISADDNALIFYLENRDQLFKDIPLVFFGVNDIDKALSLNGDPLVTGIVEAVSMKETIELITILRPNAANIAVITDNSTTGQADLRNFYKQEPFFPDHRFYEISLGELSWSEFGDTLSGIGDDTAVLLLAAFTDRYHETILFYESLNIISNNLKQPLFHLWYHGIGEGVLGGKLISMYEQAHTAAGLAVRILSGEDVSEMGISEVAENYYIFDYEQLELKSINRSLLPEGSQIVNQPKNFYTENKSLVLLIILIFIILSLFLAILLANLANRRRIEQKLRESEAKYKALFYENKSVMLILNPFDGAVIDANDAAVNYYGYSDEEIRTKNLNQISFNSEHEVQDSIDNMLKGKQDILNVKHILSDGRLRDVKIYSGSVVLKEDAFVYAIIHDVTEKNVYHREMEEARMLAEEALRVKNDFLANISHELRTPLNGIMGMLDLLKSADYSEDEQNWYKLAIVSSENLKIIIEDLLSYTKLDAGKLSIMKRFINLYEIVDLSKNIYEDKIYQKGLGFIIEKDYKSGFFLSDATRLSQIINNLLSNSLKYSIEGVIRFELHEKETALEIVISDEGIGIPPESIESIFEPFRQLEETYTKKYQGMGLGLAITKNIIESLEGEISVESEVGRGSVFTVLIPGEFRISI